MISPTQPVDVDVARLRDIAIAWWRTTVVEARAPAARLALHQLRALAALGRNPFAPAPVVAALLLPAVRDLCHRCGPGIAATPADAPELLAGGLLAAAVALAYVTDDRPEPFGAVLRGAPPHVPRFAELRFQTLIRQQTPGGLLRQTLLALRVVGGVAPVGDLGATLMLWFSPADRRAAWAMDYYGLSCDSPGPPVSGRDERTPKAS